MYQPVGDLLQIKMSLHLRQKWNADYFISAFRERNKILSAMSCYWIASCLVCCQFSLKKVFCFPLLRYTRTEFYLLMTVDSVFCCTCKISWQNKRIRISSVEWKKRCSILSRRARFNCYSPNSSKSEFLFYSKN